MTKISKVRTRTQAPGLRSSYVRLSLFQKILLTIGILIAVLTTLPVMVVLLIGLLPTFTVMVTDRNNTNKLIIVGCFNLAGVFIYLFHVISNFTVRDAFFILSDIFNLIIMLSSAGLGLIVYLEVPNLFIYLSKIAAQKRLKTLDANLEKLAKFSTIPPKRLTGLKFTEFFLWLSRSVSCISKAAPNIPDLLEDTGEWNEEEQQ